MATVPKLPDPLPPDSVGAQPNASAETAPAWSSVKSWWRTDQTRWIHKEFLSTDLLCLIGSAFVTVYARLGIAHLFDDHSFDSIDAKINLAILLLMTVVVALFCQNYGLYRSRRTRTFSDEARVIAKSLLLASALLIGFVFLAELTSFSWTVLLGSVTVDFVAMAGWRHHEFSRTERRIADGVGTRNVLIVGAGKLGHQVADCLQRNRHLGYVVKGFLDDPPQDGVLGRVEELSQVARAHFVDEIVIALPWESETAARATIEARRQRLNIKLVPNFYTGAGWRAPLEYLGDVPAFSLHREPIPAIALLMKRIIDVIVGSVGIVVLSPVFALIALLIKLDSPGPVLYCSPRVGKKGRRFKFYKFRTMVTNADELKAQLRASNERQGPFFKMKNDPRMTRIGKYLRKYSLDELPQLWNVLKGDMSLVGPRPHPLDDYNHYTLENLRRLDVMPGITGLWQVQARGDASWETNMALDLEYIEHWTPWMDIKILLKTVPVVVKGLGQ